MLKRLKIIYFAWVTVFLLPQLSWSTSLVGVWQVDDFRHQSQHIIVKIQKKNDEFEGIVLNAKGVCERCHGVFSQKSLKGMKILWGFKIHAKNLYDEGYFLDTHSGRIYRATIKISDEQCLLRSYVGIPFLGQTQVWKRYHP